LLSMLKSPTPVGFFVSTPERR